MKHLRFALIYSACAKNGGKYFSTKNDENLVALMENGALRYTVTRCYVGVAGNPDGLRDGCRVGKVFVGKYIWEKGEIANGK